MKLVGSDGGAYEQETFVNSIVISPSKRATVDVLFGSAGTYPLQHITPLKTYPLGSVAVSGTSASPSYATQFAAAGVNETVRSDMNNFRPLLAKMTDKSLTIGIDMGMVNMMQDGGGRMMFNRLAHDQGRERAHRVRARRARAPDMPAAHDAGRQHDE